MSKNLHRDTSQERRLAALEQELRLVKREQRSLAALSISPPRDVMLGRTAADNGVYPESGDTFGVIFRDCHYAPSAGAQPVTELARSAAPAVTARTLDGSYVSEGTFVLCQRIRGLGSSAAASGEWWILPPAPEATPKKWKRYTFSFGQSPIVGGGRAWTVVDFLPPEPPSAEGWEHPDFYLDGSDQLICRNKGYYLFHCQAIVAPLWNLTRDLHWLFSLIRGDGTSVAPYLASLLVPASAEGDEGNNEGMNFSVSWTVDFRIPQNDQRIGFAFAITDGLSSVWSATPGQEPGFYGALKLIAHEKTHAVV